jgi:flagellum-specific ATP synthase
LSDAGHYPAVDIEASISRVMPMVTDVEHQQLARQLKQVYSLYQQNKDLIAIGAYNKGTDPRIDQAINLLPVLNFFLQQEMRDVIPYEQSLQQLQEILSAAQAHASSQKNEP